jgi:hypothetical protein
MRLALALLAASALYADSIPAAVYEHGGTPAALWQPEAPVIEAFPSQTGFDFTNETTLETPPPAPAPIPAVFETQPAVFETQPAVFETQTQAAPVAVTPEPATSWLVALGALCFAAGRGKPRGPFAPIR